MTIKETALRMAQEALRELKPCPTKIALEYADHAMDACREALAVPEHSMATEIQVPATSAPAQPDASTTTSQTTPPNIGEHWLGQGGIYAGLCRGRDGEADYHLILSTEAPEKKFGWQAALDRAKSVSAEGHSDFTVPTRFEFALIFANLQDQCNSRYWYWTSTQFSESNAWSQYFGLGYHSSDDKVYEYRCRFVRRVQISA